MLPPPIFFIPHGRQCTTEHKYLLSLPMTPSHNHPHPLHAFIEPLLLSLRSAANKYHNELPQILADRSGPGEAEESMVWYALGYEMTDAGADHSGHFNCEDTVMLED
ncbi:hypothetical protein DFH29DRAFT_926188, partial [Suillus ampliporus]